MAPGEPDDRVIDRLTKEYVEAIQALVAADAAQDGGGLQNTSQLAMNPYRVALDKAQAKLIQETQSVILERAYDAFEAGAGPLCNQSQHDLLCRSYVDALRRAVPRIMERAVKLVFGSPVREDDSEQLTSTLTAAKALSERLEMDVERSEQWPNVTLEIWQSLDRNEDGTVEKQEFLRKFLDAPGPRFLEGQLHIAFSDLVKLLAEPIRHLQSRMVEDDVSTQPLVNSQPIDPRPLTTEEERSEIERAFSAGTMHDGDSWFLIATGWWNAWCQYTGYDNQLRSLDCFDEAIDNSFILTNGELPARAMEGVDFALVPRGVWERLQGWYGGGPPVERRVVTDGKGSRAVLRVEVHPYQLDVCYEGLRVQVVISRRALLRELLEKALLLLPVTAQERLRGETLAVVDQFGTAFRDGDEAIGDLGLATCSRLTLEIQRADGIYSRKSVGAFPAANHKKGFCGLSNLGNTCFMNSAIQCLSNTTPLREYFLTGAYREDLNRDNPLGNGGELAEAFARLLGNLWSGENSYVSPSAFKATLARFAPQFSGYQQHDSQEFIAFLLDGIHEDLNRVKVKAYVEAKESDGRPDAEVAAEAWEGHLRRNQSVVVDLFQGQLKSTLECPECQRRSITFDPFMYLSVPIQLASDVQRYIDVFFVPEVEPLTRTQRHRCQVPVSASMAKLRQVLAAQAGVPTDTVLLADVYNGKIYKMLTDRDEVSEIASQDMTVAYQCPDAPSMATSPKHHWLTAALRLQMPTSSTTDTAPRPFLLVLDASMKNSQLYDRVAELLAPVLAQAAQASDMEDDPTSPPAEPSSSSSSSSTAAAAAPTAMEHPDDTNGGDMALNDDDDDDDEVPDVARLPPPISVQVTPLQRRFPFIISWDSAQPHRDTPEFPDNDAMDLYATAYGDAPLMLDVKLDAALREGVTWPPVSDHSSVQTAVPVSPTTAEKSIMTLDKCMDLFAKREQLGDQDMVYCSQCKTHRQSFKEFRIWKLPPILVVHLKRFQFGRSAFGGRKLEDEVRFPIEDWDVAPWLVPGSPDLLGGQTHYELCAVSHHSGSLHFGHYTAYGKSGDEWLLFNDSMVSKSSEQFVQNNGAYILFYRRRDAAPPEPTSEEDQAM